MTQGPNGVQGPAGWPDKGGDRGGYGMAGIQDQPGPVGPTGQPTYREQIHAFAAGPGNGQGPVGVQGWPGHAETYAWKPKLMEASKVRSIYDDHRGAREHLKALDEEIATIDRFLSAQINAGPKSAICYEVKLYFKPQETVINALRSLGYEVILEERSATPCTIRF